MASDHRGERLLGRLLFRNLLEGTRPSGARGWISQLAPAVTQTAVGAGHWAAGRRQRALAAWTCAAGLGLVAWGVGTETPTRAEMQEDIERQKDEWRKQGLQVPVTAAPAEPTAAMRRWQNALDFLGPSTQLVLGVRSGLRRPRRLTALAVADETPLAVFYALRAARAVRQRRPRIAAGSALVVAGAAARLRAASAEPLR